MGGLPIFDSDCEGGGGPKFYGDPEGGGMRFLRVLFPKRTKPPHQEVLNSPSTKPEVLWQNKVLNPYYNTIFMRTSLNNIFCWLRFLLWIHYKLWVWLRPGGQQGVGGCSCQSLLLRQMLMVAINEPGSLHGIKSFRNLNEYLLYFGFPIHFNWLDIYTYRYKLFN